MWLGGLVLDIKLSRVICQNLLKLNGPFNSVSTHGSLLGRVKTVLSKDTCVRMVFGLLFVMS